MIEDRLTLRRARQKWEISARNQPTASLRIATEEYLRSLYGREYTISKKPVSRRRADIALHSTRCSIELLLSHQRPTEGIGFMLIKPIQGEEQKLGAFHPYECR